MSNRDGTKVATLYVELEGDTQGDWLYGVRAVKMTQKPPKVLRQAGNFVVKVRLTVPNAQFLDNIPQIDLDVPNEALTGITGTVGE